MQEEGICRAKALSEALVSRKVKASDCDSISPELADAIDGVLSLDLRLLESDPMMNKIEEKLTEIQLTRWFFTGPHDRKLRSFFL